MRNDARTITSGRRVMPIQRSPDVDDLIAGAPARNHGTRNGHAARSRVRAMNRMVEPPPEPVAAAWSAQRPPDETFIRMCSCSTH